MFNTKTVSLEWGGQTLTLETGKVARQADGAVIATLGLLGQSDGAVVRISAEGSAGRPLGSSCP